MVMVDLSILRVGNQYNSLVHQVWSNKGGYLLQQSCASKLNKSIWSKIHQLSMVHGVSSDYSIPYVLLGCQWNKNHQL